MGRKTAKGGVSCKDLSPFLWNREVTEERTVSDFILVHYYLLLNFYLLFFYSECFNFHQVRSSGFKPLKRVWGTCFTRLSPVLLDVILTSLSLPQKKLTCRQKALSGSMS